MYLTQFNLTENPFNLTTIYPLSQMFVTWSGFEAAKTAPWPSWGLHHHGKFLEPSDEWTGRGCCCFLMRWHSWAFLAHQEWALEFVELKFEFFSFKTFDVSQIFCQRVVKPWPKYSYSILLKGLCWVSVYWILDNARVPCLGCFLFFILCPIVPSIFGTICCVIF